jgi:UDP-sulfoquinovose synthase
MRVFIAGMDGYLGWSLAQHLTARGHVVGGADVFWRRRWVDEMGSCSATPIASMHERLAAVGELFGRDLAFWEGDLTSYAFVTDTFAQFEPDAIVHLGECPSAPYSMVDVDHAVFVQTNNLASTTNMLFAMRDLMPHAHLIKLGTMGEYGTPNVDIPEGFFEIQYRGRRDRLPFPRQAGSWYHWSKVHGSNNVMFACRLWGLRATDVMQGVVFGTRIDEMSADPRMQTRVDFDQAFGTAVNRFCCQAVIGHPLTPFGAGHQKRGFLPLRDSMQCLTLAIENPPERGEYRVFNQFAEIYDVTELARKVQRAAQELGMEPELRNLENPRKELEDHYYRADHDHLADLGYRPTRDVDQELRSMLGDLAPHAERIEEKRVALIPDVRWDGMRGRVRFVDELVDEELRIRAVRRREPVDGMT